VRGPYPRGACRRLLHMENLEGDQQILDRLQNLARQSMDPAMATRVLERARRRPRPWWRSTKAKVGAGVAGGFFAGSFGLASAGALPAPVQEAAHSTLAAVGISVPPGHNRYNGPECGGTYANHGAYVRAHKGDPAAAQSRCGKPTVANSPASGASTSPPESGRPGKSGRHGPPPWAHGQGKPGSDSTESPDDSTEPPETTSPGAAPSVAPTAGTQVNPAAPATTTTTAAPAPTTTVAPPTTTTSSSSTTSSTTTSTVPPTTTTAP